MCFVRGGDLKPVLPWESSGRGVGKKRINIYTKNRMVFFLYVICAFFFLSRFKEKKQFDFANINGAGKFRAGVKTVFCHSAFRRTSSLQTILHTVAARLSCK